MLVKHLNLDRLIALLANGDHWTLLKPMNLSESLILKLFVESFTVFTDIFRVFYFLVFDWRIFSLF
jgi:hypothetical protein